MVFEHINTEVENLKASLRAIEDGENLEYRPADQAGLLSTLDAFGLNDIQIITSPATLPDPLAARTLYVSNPTPSRNDDGQPVTTVNIDYVTEDIRHTENEQLDGHVEPTTERILALLAKDNERLQGRLLSAFGGYPNDSQYASKFHQAAWNLAEIFGRAVRDVSPWNPAPIATAVTKLISFRLELNKNLNYFKYKMWIPSIFDDKTYKVTLALYRFLASQQPAESEGRQITTAAGGGLEEYLFTTMPNAMLERLRAYHTEHPELEEPTMLAAAPIDENTEVESEAPDVPPDDAHLTDDEGSEILDEIEREGLQIASAQLVELQRRAGKYLNAQNPRAREILLTLARENARCIIDELIPFPEEPVAPANPRDIEPDGPPEGGYWTDDDLDARLQSTLNTYVATAIVVSVLVAPASVAIGLGLVTAVSMLPILQALVGLAVVAVLATCIATPIILYQSITSSNNEARNHYHASRQAQYDTELGQFRATQQYTMRVAIREENGPSRAPLLEKINSATGLVVPTEGIEEDTTIPLQITQALSFFSAPDTSDTEDDTDLYGSPSCTIQ